MKFRGSGKEDEMDGETFIGKNRCNHSITNIVSSSAGGGVLTVSALTAGGVVEGRS